MKTFDFLKNYLFIFWLHWVFVVARAFSLVATSEGYFLVVVHRLSCSAACGIFLDQGSNPCPLPWQVNSDPLCHQESPLQSNFNAEYSNLLLKF